ncbi:MAG: hypothetical protein IPN17_31100 [Deltaproteobacteria bacterium]|nr:hypothetical protein [Deltaproteobacteria bacterium]
MRWPPCPRPAQTVAALASLLVGACERRRRRAAPRDVEVTSVIVAADAAAPGCPARDLPRGGGTLHAGEVTRSERWRAADSPHLLPYGLVVRAGATLELEPCALLRVGRGAGGDAWGPAAASSRAENPAPHRV